MDAVVADPNQIGIYGKLTDRFGDNGLISIVLGHKQGGDLHLDLWLMSCRVLKRDMELAMLDCLVERARAVNVDTIYGYYVPTVKNSMVADHYPKLGFSSISRDGWNAAPGVTTWTLDISEYEPRTSHIRIAARPKELVTHG
jgi:predicted enzyme involved in methoxymalonyl-ACP biosynthesis